MSRSTNMLEVSTLCDDAKAFIPGQESSTASFDLIYDTAQASHANTWATAGALPVTYLPVGISVGASALLLDSFRTEYSISSSPTTTVDATLVTEPTGETGYGVCLAPLTTITANNNSASVDNAGFTQRGAILHLHVTEFSGFTSNVIRVQESTDNSTWSSLAVFDTVTGTTSQRLVITGNVLRYLRVNQVVTGTGSCTALVAVARR
jgi:hypothetical protein